MDKTFKVSVNKKLTFDLSNEDLLAIDALRTADNRYHVLQNNKPFDVKLLASNFEQKKYKVKVNSNTYEVDIANGLDCLIQEMGFSLGTTKNIGFIDAPMPGLILEISVAVGQVVKEEDPLLILEAMKMENSIISPRDGIIKTISVKQGDAVEKNQLLIEFE